MSVAEEGLLEEDLLLNMLGLAAILSMHMTTAKSENELDILFLLEKQLLRNMLWLRCFTWEPCNDDADN